MSSPRQLLTALALALACALFAFPPSLQAGGSVHREDIEGMLASQPDLQAALDEAFVLAPVGIALRLGRHFGALGGARVGPYEFPARLRSSPQDSDFVFVVILHTKALVLDAEGKALAKPGELEPHPEAASIRETLVRYEVRPATAEEREVFRQLKE